MDDTELHYLTYDPDAVWNQMIQNYVDAGGDILYPGDEKYMLLRGVQADIIQVFAGVDNALRMMTLRYAVGAYLDILGDLRRCPRITASAARATVEITTNATGKTDVLKAGTPMTADGEAFYLLEEDFILTGLAQTAEATVRAEQTGVAGNGLREGTQMGLVTTNAGVSKIIVKTAASGGEETEDDETYRDRIRNAGFAGVTTGPEIQYESAAKAVSGQILDARALQTEPGVVSVYLIMADEADKETLMNQVRGALNGRDARPLTDKVLISEAKALAYTLNIKYQSDASSATKAAIAAAAQDYQTWQDQEIGLAFNPEKLTAALYHAGATRVIYDAGSQFNGGNAEYTAIGESERCKGEINLNAMEE